MWSFKRILLLSLLYSVITLSALSVMNSVFGAEMPHSRSSIGPTQESAGRTPGARAVAGLNAGEQSAPGVVYAPRDVVDMTRLVLETNRDETAHLAHYIEHATTVIVVFFSILGAAGTVFGIKKVDDIERRAKTLTASFEEAVEKSTEKVTTLQTDFERKTADAEALIQQKVSLTEANLHLEINDHMELVSGRLEIEQALTRNQSVEEANRQLMNAVRRIERAVKDGRVADQAKVRAFADLAYAKKRLQDLSGAYEAIVNALAVAGAVGEKDPARLGLLNYNAACYACLLGKIAETVAHLQQAIAFDPHWKRKADDEKDFEAAKADTTFIALIRK